MKRLLLTMTLAALLLLVSAGCDAQDAIPAASDTPSPAPQTIRPTSTVQPSETIISADTAVPPTATPTVTITPTPAGPLNEEGPWILLFSGSSFASYPSGRHLFAMNADGSGFRILEDDEVLEYAINPLDWSLIAYIAQENSESVPELRIVQLPEGTIKALTPLTTEAIAPQIEEGMLYAAITTTFIERYSYTGFTAENGGLAWSPDGTKIAFVGALDEPSVDVYVLDIPTGQLTRVADLENYQQIYGGDYDGEVDDNTRHAAQLSWSPDSRYVHFEDFMYLNMDTAWTIFSNHWAASADGTRSLLLMRPEGPGSIDTFGWQDGIGATILMSQGIRYGQPIAAINLDTGAIKTIVDEPVEYATYAPEHNTWLLLPSQFEPQEEIRGALQILRPDGTRIDLPDITALVMYGWFDDEEAFRVSGEEFDYRVMIDGSITEMAPHHFPFETYPGENRAEGSLSPDQTLIVWVSSLYESFSGVWVGEPFTEPEMIHFADNIGNYKEDEDNLIVDDALWSPDSQQLVLLTNQGVYLARRPGFELVQISNGTFIAYPFGRTVRWLP